MNYKNIIRHIKAPKSKANIADRVFFAGAILFLATLATFFTFGSMGLIHTVDGGRNGRDVKRVSDVKQLQSAFELYADTCGGYPVVPIATVVGSSGFNTSFHEGCPEGTSLETFVRVLPNNPHPGGEPYRYCSTASPDSSECAPSGESYVITFSLEENISTLSSGKHFVTPEGMR
jgi:hypothetical protein